MPAPLTCTTARASTYLQPHPPSPSEPRTRPQTSEPNQGRRARKRHSAGLGRTFRGEGLQVEDRLLALADAVLVERCLLADVHHQRLVGLGLRTQRGRRCENAAQRERSSASGRAHQQLRRELLQDHLSQNAKHRFRSERKVPISAGKKWRENSCCAKTFR